MTSSSKTGVDATVIGQTTFVRGRVTGSGDIEIAGRIEGDVTCSGEVVVEASGLVAASISATRIVVRGAVKGDLAAEESLTVESGARVVGDLRAPRVSIAAGGLVRGHVATTAAGAERTRAATATAMRTPEKRERRSATGAAETSRSVESSGHARVVAAPSTQLDLARETNHRPPRGATLAGARVGPPPPIVPVLKKGTKAIQKKRG
jgi:cytoskeletal protein CcmA (bactofilin family)